MFKKVLTAFIFNLSLIINAQSWTQLADFPSTPRDDGSVFVINNKAYCFTGVGPTGCTGNGYVFDVATETWSAMASLPAGNERQYAAAFTYSNIGYMMGGLNCSNIRLNDFWQYTPTTNSWTALPDFPGIGRLGTSNFIIKNKVYIIGGILVNGTICNEVWEYNFTTSTWLQKNNIPVSGSHRGSAFVIDTLGYFCCGLNNTSSYNNYMYQYNFVNDTWRRVSNLTLPAKYYVGTAVCNNKAGLYGGQDSAGTISNNYTVFNPLDSSLTNLTGIPTYGRKGGMVFSINNSFYITTGISTAFGHIKETWKNTALVGLNELKIKNDDLKIYPNPTNDILNVELGVLNGNTTYALNIYNSIGQLIKVDEITFKNNLVVIDTKDLVNGVYVLTLFDGSTSLTTGTAPSSPAQNDRLQTVSKRFVIAR